MRERNTAADGRNRELIDVKPGHFFQRAARAQNGLGKVWRIEHWIETQIDGVYFRDNGHICSGIEEKRFTVECIRFVRHVDVYEVCCVWLRSANSHCRRARIVSERSPV